MKTGREAIELERWLSRQPEVLSFSGTGEASLLVCEILKAEIGGPNDDLARFIYDENNAGKISRENLRAEIGQHLGKPCVHIRSSQGHRLRLTIPHLNEVVLSQEDGRGFLLSPLFIAEYLKSRGLTPVLMRPWIEQVIFSSFDTRSERYQDQLWVLRNNDVKRFASLVADGKVVLQGMHDIVAHIAGARQEGMAYAASVAKLIDRTLTDYFGASGKGNLPSHLVPFLIGLILDDLTQMPFYESETRAAAVRFLLETMPDLVSDPQAPLLLRGFPQKMIGVLEVIRDEVGFSRSALGRAVSELFDECRALIVTAEDLRRTPQRTARDAEDESPAPISRARA